jgi:hypothetical protein
MSEQDTGHDYFPGGNMITNLAMRVGSMEGTVKTFMDNWARQDALANEGRRLLNERLELIGKQIDRIATDVMNVQQDIAELKKEVDEEVMPSIKADELNKQRQIGAKGVWALISAGVVAAASMLAYIGDKVASFFWAKP